MTTTYAYVVHFEPVGYYAKNQPHYEWAFTEDINKALVYVTKEAAIERLEHGIGLARTKNSHITSKEPMLYITSGTVDEVSIEIEFFNTVMVLDTIPKAPPIKLVCDELWKRINERMESAIKAGKYSTSLNSIADNGQGVRGLGMYLSSGVYNELCERLKNELGLGIKIDVGPIPNHRVYWSKFNLARGV